MADYKRPGVTPGLDEETRLLQEFAPTLAEAKRRQDQYAESLESSDAIEAGAARTRSGLAEATGELTSALERNVAAAATETARIEESTAALREQLALRRELANTPVAGGGSLAAPSSGRAPLAPAALADTSGLAVAEERLAAAYKAQAAAIVQRRDAQTALGAATRPGATATPEEVAPLVAARAEAGELERITAAQAQTARRNLELARSEEAQRVSLGEELAAQNRAAADARIAQRRSEAQQLIAGPGASEVDRFLGANYSLAMSSRELVPYQRPGELVPYQGGGGWRPPGGGGPGGGGPPGGGEPPIGPPPAGPPGGGPPDDEIRRYQADVDRLAASERAARQEVQLSAAAYADSSTRLSQHGALTSEFISALARGQVTMGQFGEQVVQTIGKFGGWAIAGAAVYGVYDALRKTTEGATAAQGAVLNLSRFLPGLGGPYQGGAGGTSQVSHLYDTLGGISTEFNVPVSEAADAMQLVARTFHSVNDAGQAASAVLAAYRLDQVGLNDAARYLTGIYQSTGRQSYVGGANRPENVIDSLNALQNEYSARVSETLPAVARAAPLFTAQGGNIPELEALSALGVRGGLSGNSVGTALLRSATFAFRPSSEALLGAKFGIDAQPGELGDLYTKVLREVADRSRSGTLTGVDLTSLASALGGNQLGARSILPILTQQALDPGKDFGSSLYGRALSTTQHPPSYEADLERVTGTLSEQFKSLGIGLENFGLKLAESGALAPVSATIGAVGQVGRAFEVLLSPLFIASDLFSHLPGVLQDMIGAVLAVVALRRLADTSLGNNALQFIGRLPGAQDLQNSPRAAVFGTRARIGRELIPFAQQESSQADRRMLSAGFQNEAAAARATRAAEALAAAPPERSAEMEAQLEAAEGEAATAARRYAAAKEAAVEAGQRLAQLEADQVILAQRSLTYDERVSYMKMRGYTVEGEYVNLREQAVAQARADLAEYRRSGAAGAAGMTAGAAAAVAAQTQATAAAERTPFIVNPQGEVVPPADYASAAARTSTEAAAAAAAATGVRAAQQVPSAEFVPYGLAAVRARASERAGDIGKAVMNPGAWADRAEGAWNALNAVPGGVPMAALLASQLVGSQLPQGRLTTGITNEVGTFATGAMISQLLGKGAGPGLAAAGVLDLASSVSTGDTGGAVGGGAGMIVGGGIGAFFGGPLGAAVGAGIGEAAGKVIGDIVGGGPQSPGDAQTEAARRSRDAVRKATAHENAGMPEFARNLQNDLEDAAYGSGSTQSGAAARVGATIQRGQALIAMFGTDSPQGRAGRDVLNQAIATSIAEAASGNPVQSLNTLQTATQAREQFVDSQFKFSLAQNQGPTGGVDAAANANARSQSLYDETWQAALDQTAQAVVNARRAVNDAIKKGSNDDYKKAQAAFDAAREEATGVQSAARIAHATTTLTQQQRSLQGVQADQQYVAAQEGLAVAQAGGDKLAVSQAQQNAATQNLAQLASAQANPRTRLAARDYQMLSEAQQAALINARNNQTQVELSRAQSRDDIAVARTPLGDAAAVAAANVKKAADSWRFMRDHRAAFDQSAINEAFAQMIDAQKQVAQATQQQADQSVQAAEQVAELQDYGNVVAQAADKATGARQALANALKLPPGHGRDIAVAQAQAGVLQAGVAGYEAAQQRGQTQTSLAVAQATGDPLAQAQARLRGDQSAYQRSLGLGPNAVDAQAALYAQVVQDQAAVQQSQFDRVRQLGALREAQAQGDPVAVARVTLQVANQERAAASTYEQQVQAQTDLVNAQYTMSKALQEQDKSVAELQASTTRDPIQQLRDQIGGAVKSLRDARGPAAHRQAQTELNNLHNQLTGEHISTTESTIDFQLSMQQITAQQAVTMLQALENTRNITTKERQQLETKVRQIQMGQYSTIGGGQATFDFAPGNVPMPTFYDVERAAGRHTFGEGPLAQPGRPAPAHHTTVHHPVTHHAGDVATTINVYVRHGGDVTKVADAIDRSVGSNLKARLRTAGIRGT